MPSYQQRSPHPFVPAKETAFSRFRLWRRITVATLAGMMVFLAGAYLATGKIRRHAAVGHSGRVMLAVLPFRNLSNDREQEYFADGLTAEMISQLGRLSADRLGVISWQSTQGYKGTKLTEDKIAWDLGANYLLEGTVRRSGNHVRITAELIKAEDLSHVWADSYDGELGDVITAQNRVADAIAREVQGHFVTEKPVTVVSMAPAQPGAYDAYLKGIAPPDGDRQVMQAKIENFRQAIRLNGGNYAPAYTGVAMSLIFMASHGLAPSSDSYEKALDAVNKALQLDPLLPDAHDDLAWIEWRYRWDFAAAEREFRRGLELQPNGEHIRESYSLFLKSRGRYPEALQQIEFCLQQNPRNPYTLSNAASVLALLGRHDEAQARFRAAIASSPNSHYPHERQGTALLWQGRVAEAIEEFKQARLLSDDLPETTAWLAYAYALNHQPDEAEFLLGELDRKSSRSYVSPYHVALVYAGLGQKEQVLAWLDKAVAQRDEWLVYLHVAPEFASLHSDPHFQQIESRVGLTKTLSASR